MKSKQNVRWLALVLVVIALTLAAGTVFAASEAVVPWQEGGDQDVAVVQPADRP